MNLRLFYFYVTYFQICNSVTLTLKRLMFLKWSDPRQTFCSICCKIFDICLTTLWIHQALGYRVKGDETFPSVSVFQNLKNIQNLEQPKTTQLT